LLALALSLGTAHPHLFFTAADVPALRDAAATTHKPIADHYLATVAAHLSDPPPAPSDYGDARFLGNQVAVWAFAYQLTGDPRYAEKARSQILTYLTWADWSFGQGMDLNEAHMLLGVAVAYDLIYEALSAVDQQAIASRLGTEAQKMSLATPTAWWVDQYTQNHNWIDSAGLGLAALALSGEDVRAPVWLAAAEANLQKLSLVLGPIADGSFHEGGPYEVYGLSMALPFWTALARTGADYTNLGILKGYGGFRLGAMLPDQPRAMLLPYGDFTGWPTQGTIEILRYAAARFGDGTAEAAAQQWLTSGRGSFLPELWYELFEFLYYTPSVQALPRAQWPLDSSFPDLQAAVLKSSWSALDLQLGFKAGPYGGRANFDRLKIGGAPGGWISWGHDHNDDMSFWLFGNGVWLAPEAMGYTAGKNTTATNPANYTSYHNSLLVDGNGLLGDVRASDSNWNNPWFFARDAVPLLQTTGTADYAFTGGRGANLFDPALGVSRWDRLAAGHRQERAVAGRARDRARAVERNHRRADRHVDEQVRPHRQHRLGAGAALDRRRRDAVPHRAGAGIAGGVVVAARDRGAAGRRLRRRRGDRTRLGPRGALDLRPARCRRKGRRRPAALFRACRHGGAVGRAAFARSPGRPRLALRPGRRSPAAVLAERPLPRGRPARRDAGRDRRRDRRLPRLRPRRDRGHAEWSVGRRLLRGRCAGLRRRSRGNPRRRHAGPRRRSGRRSSPFDGRRHAIRERCGRGGARGRAERALREGLRWVRRRGCREPVDGHRRARPPAHTQANGNVKPAAWYASVLPQDGQPPGKAGPCSSCWSMKR
jgi:hypothetical protein